MNFWYKVLGYDKSVEIKEFGQRGESFENGASIEVTANDEAEALEKAKAIIKKPLYRITSAGEINPAIKEDKDIRDRQTANNEKIAELNAAMGDNIKAFGEAVEKLASK